MFLDVEIERGGENGRLLLLQSGLYNCTVYRWLTIYNYVSVNVNLELSVVTIRASSDPCISIPRIEKILVPSIAILSGVERREGRSENSQSNSGSNDIYIAWTKFIKCFEFIKNNYLFKLMMR